MIIATTITVSGQTQSPADIAAKWKELQHLCEKYDDGADSAYRILNEQIAATKRDLVANAIWHSCLAQFLDDYYNGNRYRLRQRTEVAEETPKDFKEWDSRTFQRRAREEYLLSLKDAKALQAVDAKECGELLLDKVGNFCIPVPGKISCRALRSSLIISLVPSDITSGQFLSRPHALISLCLGLFHQMLHLL